MTDIRTTEACRAIEFKCAYCGARNLVPYSLEWEWDLVRVVEINCDVIKCDHCGKDNKVVERLWNEKTKDC